MEDQVVLCVDEQEAYNFNGETSLEHVECRICQEDDEPLNLEVPCGCTGSLKYAHRKCVQRWCNEKGDTTCEICHQPYRPGYTSPQRIQADEVSIDIRGSWGISGAVMDLNDSRLLTIAAVEHQFLEDEFSEYTLSNASGAACFRSAALCFFALLLLRSALMIANADQEEDLTTLFILFLMRTAGFLLTCYLIVRAMSIVQCPRQRQEASIAVADVALLMQATQTRGLQFAATSGSLSHH